jgi:hypothetical protein
VQASAVAAEQQQFVLDTRNIIALTVAFMVRRIGPAPVELSCIQPVPDCKLEHRELLW